MTVFFTKEAIDWLILILEERFGHSFYIMQSNQGLKLSLKNKPERYILFPNLNKMFHQSSSDMPCSYWDATKEGWDSVIGEPIPAPAVAELRQPLIEYNNNDCFTVHYDILGLTYWMLNRIEEIGRTDLDEHQRFPATSSHACKYGYIERPIVDEWLNILGQVITGLWSQLKLKKHQFSIKVSHDVDAPSRYGFKSPSKLLRSMLADIIKRKDFKGATLAPIVRMNNRYQLSKLDPFNTFNWLMDLSEANNLQSSFYFICGRTDPLMDADYELEHPSIRNLLQLIHKRGHEIGLHPSYNSFKSPNIIKREADRLRTVMDQENINQPDIGGRMHVLRWTHPLTLQAWNDASLSYDSTLGYADMPGFRCGTCFEYPAFNPMTQKILDVRIRPLIAMECSVIDKRYLGLGYTQGSLDKFMQLKDTCKRIKGCFTLLWHNSHFQYDGDKYIYKRLIKNT
ncbi:polysaccharide deacetylase family protein [Psychrobacter lutiphocae]|uniref:polysaccharide deacetylase family protein n=1 Tax=Psychrobacter lutiphocae TaxID=540500 RepID=UPI0003663794|nr:polysaccharide deacetylase family protein [Psychrobacter lutiphocae]